MKKLNRTYLCGIFSLIFAAWITYQTTLIPNKLVSNEPGPKLFPFISAIGIAAFAILSMVFDGRKEAGGESRPYLDGKGYFRLLLIMLECLLFAVFMNFIGFWFTSVLGLFAFIWTLKGDKKINLPFAIILCILLGSACHFGFTKGFNIPLPTGTLWRLLGIKMI